MFPRPIVALLLTFTLLGVRARALVTGSGDNTTDPQLGQSSDPWANVGHLNGASGVYIGDGWVLTANHVGAGTIDFDIGSFAWDGVNSFQIGGADLRLFHLAQPPNLVSLEIASVTPVIGTAIEYIGYGFRRGSEEKTYNISATHPDEKGFDWTANNGTKSWGTNNVAGSEYVESGFNAQTFYSEFNSGISSSEAQAAAGDSGSGTFIYRKGKWILAGITVAIGTLDDPARNPYAAYALYGETTYAVDLATYDAEIAQHITAVPEPSGIALGLMLAGMWGLGARPRRK